MRTSTRTATAPQTTHTAYSLSTRSASAISVGIVERQPVLDLDYREDSSAETDMNVVMAEGGGLIELQGTAERAPFDRQQLDQPKLDEELLEALRERGYW